MTKIFFADIINNKICGFYVEGLHEDIPNNCIKITDELWEYILINKAFIVNLEDMPVPLKEKNLEDTVYGIEYKNYFSEEPVGILPDIPPCLDERVSSLENENSELLLNIAIKDSKIEMLENDMADLMFEIAKMKNL